jgi:hypothetical protein
MRRKKSIPKKDGKMARKTTATTSCLLTPIPQTVNRYTGKAGSLQMVVEQVRGRTDLDTVNSKVSDITDINSPVAVDHTCDRTSFSFTMESQKKYFVSLTFVQLDDPFNAKAKLNEGCGQNLDLIDVTNLFPGYIIEVA